MDGTSNERNEREQPDQTRADGGARRAPAGRRLAAFVRHGHFDRPERTASAHSLYPLSDVGVAQAKAAAKTIATICAEMGLVIDRRIESSQLLRAWQTARHIATALESHEAVAGASGKAGHFRVVEHDELIERGLGSATNLSFDRIEALLAEDPRRAVLPKGWRRMPEFRLPVQGAESLMQAGARVAARVATSLDSISDEDPRDLVRLFVAHSGCLRHAAVVLGALDVRSVPELSMDFAQAVLLEKLPNGDWIHVAGQFKKHLPGA